VVFGIKGFFEMYSQKTSNVILVISGVLLTFVIIVLSNTVSRVGHFPNHCFNKKTPSLGVFSFLLICVNQIGVSHLLVEFREYISQSLGFISGKKHLLQSRDDAREFNFVRKNSNILPPMMYTCWSVA
jgi:hypothetical protein